MTLEVFQYGRSCSLTCSIRRRSNLTVPQEETSRQSRKWRAYKYIDVAVALDVQTSLVSHCLVESGNVHCTATHDQTRLSLCTAEESRGKQGWNERSWLLTHGKRYLVMLFERRQSGASRTLVVIFCRWGICIESIRDRGHMSSLRNSLYILPLDYPVVVHCCDVLWRFLHLLSPCIRVHHHSLPSSDREGKPTESSSHAWLGGQSTSVHLETTQKHPERRRNRHEIATEDVLFIPVGLEPTSWSWANTDTMHYLRHEIAVFLVGMLFTLFACSWHVSKTAAHISLILYCYLIWSTRKEGNQEQDGELLNMHTGVLDGLL